MPTHVPASSRTLASSNEGKLPGDVHDIDDVITQNVTTLAMAPAVAMANIYAAMAAASTMAAVNATTNQDAMNQIAQQSTAVAVKALQAIGSRIGKSMA